MKKFTVRLRNGYGKITSVFIEAIDLTEATAKADKMGDWVDILAYNYAAGSLELEYVH